MAASASVSLAPSHDVEIPAIAGEAEAAPAAAPAPRWLPPALRRLKLVLPRGRALKALLSIGCVALAVLLLAAALGDVDPAAVAAAAGAVTPGQLGLALGFTALSYLALTGYDLFALRHLGRRLPVGAAVATSFCAFAISYTVGLSWLVAGAIRARGYRGHGVTAGEAARIVVVSGVTLWLGIAAVFGVGLIAAPQEVARVDGLPALANQLVGAAVLAGIAGYLAFVGTGRRTVGAGPLCVALPGARSTLAQLPIGAVDVLASAAALYVLLPAGAPDLGTFAVLFVAATILGMLTHTPGGVGIFDAALIVALPGVPKDGLVAALVLWRVVYFLLPALAAGGIALAAERQVLRRVLGAAERRLAAVLRPVAPPVTAAAVLSGGLVLLFSSMTPEIAERVSVLRHVVPLAVIEVAHLVSCVVGLMLAVVAIGLRNRLHNAHRAARLLLAAGIALSLLKGIDVEDAGVLAAALGLLLVNRRAFFRRGELSGEAIRPEWVLLLGLVALAALALGLRAYHDVPFEPRLWWQFADEGDASRFLRASAGIGLVVLAFAVHALLHRTARPAAAPPADAELVARIVARDPQASANLAFVGSKRFLIAPEGDAFIMYEVRGRSWVAMGGPVGAPERAPALVRAFADLADANAGWPVFYQVGPERLPIYLEEGFTFLKLGEEARVPLARFTIEGGAGEKLRYAIRKAGKEGMSFEWVPPEGVPAIVGELAVVSEAWLAAKSGAEKSFSLGAFDPAYLARFPVAVMRHEGRIVAFASLWISGDGGDYTVDLMRQLPDAPKRVMEAMFVHMMLHAKAQGAQWFGLGMAPLSGLSTHGRAPAWNRVGAFVARRASDAYNFHGLRAFKEKFDPVWEPRYLACARGLAVPRVLIDVTSLVSGGVLSAMRKAG